MSDRREGWRRWWGSGQPSAAPGPGLFVRWPVVGCLFLLPIVVPVVRDVADGVTTFPRSGFELVLLAAYSVCYLIFPHMLFRDRAQRAKILFGFGMLALGWLVVLFVHDGNLYVLIYAMAVIAFGLPPAWAVAMDGGSLLVGAALALWGAGKYGSTSDIGAVVGVTTALFFMGRLLYTVRTLREAQDEIATLAVNAERARLARDLHDILGHSLTTITVKAGLARRVLETGNDNERAITEIHEVEGLARSALSDVRATVSEYREVSLSAELVGARAALRAAEIDADLPHAVDNVRPDLQQTFGYVLREAVTNVLRHSGAKQVKVRLGGTWMEIEDDGVGAPAAACGNGLRGLSERLAEVGGTLRVESHERGGLMLRAEVRPALEAAS
ncbi:sensor histidine kinase [Amycolatopsis sp.]|uniref:sensor histidine kinase n=1 Tax=Amycolatopsis sp. TaxID=37632 RepID=UPI002C9551E2|nr:sensor histidine kinase [Amycolatopsis sp.]HVV09401.1 sensor histidine kinase [Amycolatopsis sp.]